MVTGVGVRKAFDFLATAGEAEAATSAAITTGPNTRRIQTPSLTNSRILYNPHHVRQLTYYKPRSFPSLTQVNRIGRTWRNRQSVARYAHSASHLQTSPDFGKRRPIEAICAAPACSVTCPSSGFEAGRLGTRRSLRRAYSAIDSYSPE